MTDRIAERIQDLEVSIRAALEDTEVVKRPFDSFDASLSECIWEEIQKDESSLFRREDVLVWTALEQDEGGCDAQR